MIRADFIAGLPFILDGKHYKFKHNPRDVTMGFAIQIYPKTTPSWKREIFGVTTIDDHRIEAFRVVENEGVMTKDDIIDFTIDLESLEKVGGDHA